MKKDRLIIISIISIVFILLIVSCFFSYLISKQNKQKKSEQLYIIITQYEVNEFHFDYTKSSKIILNERFNDELYYNKIITTENGSNHILIENGIARIIDADCRGKDCTYVTISNDDDLLNVGFIQCQPHGIEIKWEVKNDN